MEVTTHTTQETKNLAEQLVSSIKGGEVFALYGDLGSGKTTFVRFFAEALGSKSRVQSPTFVIHRKYTSPKLEINHLDLYRMQNTEELVDLGLEELFLEKNAVTLIEWPEVAEELLPKNCIKLYFDYVDEDTRKIKISN